MKLYVIRHGESENNKKGLYTGWLDVSLTEKGLEDARRAGDIISGVKFDRVFSSDLVRAVETAKAALPGYEIDTDRNLREINIGDIAGKPVTVMTDELRLLASKEGYSSLGGESLSSFRERIRTFLSKVEELECDTVAAFAHAGTLRGILDEIVGSYLPRKHIYCANCTVAVFEFTGSLWRLHSWINI